MENKDIDKAAREIPQSEHDACNYANNILAKVRDENIECFPKSMLWAVAHDGYLSRQPEIDELNLAVDGLRETCDHWEERAKAAELRAQELIETLEEMMWIPVNERLPDYEDSLNPENRYLVKVSQGSIDAKTLTTIGWLRTKYGKWNVESDWVNVTHWRPIDTPKATQLLEKYGKK